MICVSPGNAYHLVTPCLHSGWGRDELNGFKYWGTLHGDIQEDIKGAFPGTSVLSAALGPISSNWDRVCELFAQIRGGTVDYGYGPGV